MTCQSLSQGEQRMNLKRLLVAPILALVLAGAAVVTAPPQKADASETHCGIVSCSYYLSGRQTHHLANNIDILGGGLAGLDASCSLLVGMLTSSPFGVYGCTVVVVAYGSFMLNAIHHADNTQGCFRIRYFPVAGAYEFYNDHSLNCHWITPNGGGGGGGWKKAA